MNNMERITEHPILGEIEEKKKVKFLYDDFGALFRTGIDFAPKLRAEGFQVEVFNPIHKYISKLFMNFRNHQKIIVIVYYIKNTIILLLY